MKHTMHRGVNLGGWLVVEPWLTPWLFDGTNAKDEYGLMDHPDAANRIAKHRATYITEADWKWLAEHEVHYVRIPIGYWIFGDEPPFMSAKEQLEWALRMAETHGIQVLLDVHGIKGSQNGEMHSGQEGKADWWRFRHESLAFLERLARTYGNRPALWGIEIMNEPKFLGNYWKLLWYYRAAYKILCRHVRKGVVTVFSDGYVGPLMAGALWPRKGYPVAMDSHYYLLFGNLFSWMKPKHYDRLRHFVYSASIWFGSLWQPVIVGEWSSVLPHAMLDRIPESEHLKVLATTIRNQRRMYCHATHTFYWNYKANGPGMYNYKSLIDEKVITP